ncbi:MAG: DMT family transporter [Lachnospiraceae bacterium]|nr:DMT family transporter [Lachnospiraceae bacterium]
MQNRRLGYFSIIMCAVIFSTMEVALKTVSGVFSPLQITALRFLIGGTCLIPFALHSLKKRGRKLEGKDVFFFLGEGLLCVALSMVFYQLGVQYSPASVVAVVFSSNALFTTIFAGLILKEPLGKQHFIALGLEVIAILLIVDPAHRQLDPRGIACALIGAVFFALYGVGGRRKSMQYGSITVSCGSMLFGSLLLISLILIGRIPAVSSALKSGSLSILADIPLFKGIPASALPTLLYVGLVVSAIGYVFHMLGFENTSAREGALVFFIKPMLAPVFALIFLKEEIPPIMWAGIVLFLIGAGIAIGLIPLPGKKKEQEESGEENE